MEITRRGFLASVPAAKLGQPKHRVHCRVTIPHIKRDDMIELISTFFGRGDQAAKQRFDKVLGEAAELTLVLTTEPGSTIKIDIL